MKPDEVDPSDATLDEVDDDAESVQIRQIGVGDVVYLGGEWRDVWRIDRVSSLYWRVWAGSGSDKIKWDFYPGSYLRRKNDT